jgi:pyridoxamine 5'-phosphate oxidase
MNEPLPDTAPDFDQPIAVLKHCHGPHPQAAGDLEKLLAHLPEHGADEQARQAAPRCSSISTRPPTCTTRTRSRT